MLIHTCSACGSEFLAGIWQSRCPKCRVLPSLLILLTCLMVSACGGGGGSSAAPVPSPVTSSPSGPTTTPCNPSINCGPATPPPSTPSTCAVNAPEANCTCPASAPGNNLGICTPAPLPACSGYAPIAACVCVAPNTANNLGVCIPPPSQCPTEEYGTPPNCMVIPQCSQVIGGYWGGPATGCVCPAGETGTYPQCVGQPCPAGTYGTPGNCLITPTCSAFSGSYWGGNACECPADWTGFYPSCLPPATPCATFDPTASGNFPNCSCPTGEVWDTGQCITPTISCSSYPPANGVWPSCSCPAPQMWNNAALACQAPAVPDTLSCATGTDSSGNAATFCSYTSPNPSDECSIWDMSATSGPYILNSSGQGLSTGNVQGPQLFSVPITFSLQCSLTTGTTYTVLPP